MDRYAPGVYTIRNVNGDSTSQKIMVDNVECYSMGGTLMTVNVRNILNIETGLTNFFIQKVANDYYGIVGNTGEAV